MRLQILYDFMQSNVEVPILHRVWCLLQIDVFL